MALNAQQIQQLIDALQTRHRLGMTSCKAKFDGSHELYKVEAFINEVEIFKGTEHISDADALQGLPLLFKSDASTWWEGIRTTIATSQGALTALRDAYAPPLKDYQIYTKIIESKQLDTETTEKYICRQRALMSRLRQNHIEAIQIDLIYGGLLQFIRKDMPRDTVTIFTELLTRARVIEEHRREVQLKTKFCDYCKMRNHSTADCTRKTKTTPTDNKEQVDQNVVKCYGCGKQGFIRSNCPDCASALHAASIELDFAHIMLTLESPIPNVECHVNGLSENAFFDTAAKTSIASDDLYRRLLEKGCQSISRIANIKQADGKIKQDTVKIIQTTIEIQNQTFTINSVVLSDTDRNRTLLGIDFLEQAGIVISPIQRGWWFTHSPQSIYYYDCMKNYTTSNGITSTAMPVFTTKSKKRRIRQMRNIQKMNSKKENQLNKENEFVFKKPEMLPQIQWNKPKMIDLPTDAKPDISESTTDDQLTDQTETILNLIHSKYLNPIKPVSPIKSPPKKIPKKSKLKLKIQDLFGSDSDSSPERPRTPGADLDILDLNTIEINYEDMPIDHQIALNNLVHKYEDIFQETGPPCSITTHKINTGNHLPISNPPYRMSPKKRESMKQELDLMLEQDIIEESDSPWAFQVIMIPKKDGSIRFCVDYRKLNAITIKDSFPLQSLNLRFCLF